MSEFITFQYPAYFIIFCLLTAFGYAYLFYRKNNFRKDKRILALPTIFMFVFRFFSVFLIALLLLAPLWRSITQSIEKPVVAMLVDNSKSVVLNPDSQYYKQSFPDELNRISEELSDDFEVQRFLFSEETQRNGDPDFEGQGTNIANALEHARGHNYGRNLGAVVLFSDGIYNRGANPLFTATEAGVPVFTVGLGDTVPPKDLLIADVIHNRVVYAGNEFQVRVRINARKFDGEASTLKVYQGNELIKETPFQIEGDEFYLDKDLFLKAGEPGMINYRFEVEGLENEINYENNSRSAIIEVMESKQSILIVSAAPHPDIQAIRSSIERQERFEVTHLMADEYVSRESEMREKIPDFHLVILYQLPLRGVNTGGLFNAITEHNTPLFFVLGSRTDGGLLNRLEAGFSIDPFSGRHPEVLSNLRDGFTYFHISGELSGFIDDTPPLHVPAEQISISGEHEVLLESRDRRRQALERVPLMFFINRTVQPIGVINGEGIWRWFMYDYRDHGNHRLMDDLVYQSIRFLSADRERERFSAEPTENVFNENESVRILAEFYNEAFQPITDASVFLEIEDEHEQIYDFTFRLDGNQYIANAGFLQPGNYSYRAFTEYGDNLYEDQGSFVVERLDIEWINLAANHNMLRSVAERTGGSFFNPETMNNLPNVLRQLEEVATVSHRDYEYNSAIHEKWLFFLIMMFISAEWFMRKYFGAY